MAFKTLADFQALDPLLLNVKEHCSFTDYFIICSGASKRQVQAQAEHLQEELAKAGVKPLGVEGVNEGLWVLLDYNAVVVHIFFQELRDFYDLEGLWAEALGTSPEPAPKPESGSESSSHEK
ncbi:MAG: ribosome silencing factor [Desulfobaccales bacterium]